MSDVLMFGDSNLLVFQHLHAQPGYESWRPAAKNPVCASPVLTPDTIVEMEWTQAGARPRVLQVSAFVGASAGGLRKQETTGGEIRRRVANRGGTRHHLVFLFGQGDLDFVLFHVLGRSDVDADAFVRERAEGYMEFIGEIAGPGAMVTVLGIHPITVPDGQLLAFFRRYGLELPRFAGVGIEEILAACPHFGLPARRTLRRSFAAHMSRLCRGNGFTYADIGDLLAHDFVVRPEFACADPLEVHVSLPHVLPLWLQRLDFLENSGRRAEG